MVILGNFRQMSQRLTLKESLLNHLLGYLAQIIKQKIVKAQTIDKNYWLRKVTIDNFSSSTFICKCKMRYKLISRIRDFDFEKKRRNNI